MYIKVKKKRKERYATIKNVFALDVVKKSVV